MMIRLSDTEVRRACWAYLETELHGRMMLNNPWEVSIWVGDPDRKEDAYEAKVFYQITFPAPPHDEEEP